MHASFWYCLPHLEYRDPSDWSDLDDIKAVVDNELLSLSKPLSWEGEETQVTEVFGLSNAYYGPGPLGADGVMVGSQNCQLQMCLLEGNF